MTIWQIAATAFSTLATMLVGYLIHRQSKYEDVTNTKIEQLLVRIDSAETEIRSRVNRDECKVERKECLTERKEEKQKRNELLNEKFKALWTLINGHSHEGLEPDAAVIRRVALDVTNIIMGKE